MASKMGQLAMQLDELGYESVEEAEADGYTLDDNGILHAPIDQAHEDWEKERDELVADLNELMEVLKAEPESIAHDVLTHAIDFIKRSSM